MRESLRTFLGLSALVFVFGGCTDKSFPQYTADFELVGEPVVKLSYGSYSAEEVLGTYQLPKRIRVTDGMYFQYSSFFHYLRFDPMPNPLGTKLAADASFSASLSELTRVYAGSWENPQLNGMLVSKEAGPHPGTDPGCWLDYEWRIFVHPKLMQPTPENLAKLYDSHTNVEVAGGKTVEVLLAENERAEPPINTDALAEWQQSLVDGKGLTFVLELHLDTIGNGGCSPVSGVAPTMDRPTGTITATYHADLSTYDDRINSVIQDPGQLTQGTDHGEGFFSQLIQKPWTRAVAK